MTSRITVCKQIIHRYMYDNVSDNLNVTKYNEVHYRVGAIHTPARETLTRSVILRMFKIIVQSKSRRVKNNLDRDYGTDCGTVGYCTSATRQALGLDSRLHLT